MAVGAGMARRMFRLVDTLQHGQGAADKFPWVRLGRLESGERVAGLPVVVRAGPAESSSLQDVDQVRDGAPVTGFSVHEKPQEESSISSSLRFSVRQ